MHQHVHFAFILTNSPPTPLKWPTEVGDLILGPRTQKPLLLSTTCGESPFMFFVTFANCVICIFL